MELTIERKIFLEALHLAQGIADRRVTLPILAHVLVTADGEGLVVAAADQEIGVRRRCAAEVTRPGAATAQARVLYDVIRAAPDGPVTLRSLDRQRLEIRAGRAQFRIMGLDPGEFPTMPSVQEDRSSEELKIPAADLRRMLQRTAFAVCEDDTRLSLAGIYFDLRQSGLLKLVATDGHRLSQESLHIPDRQGSSGVIVPRKGVFEMLKVLETAAEEVSVRVGSRLVFLLAGETELAMRTVQGEFPDYRQVIRETSPNTAVIPVGPWVDTLKRVEILSSERTRGVKLRFAQGFVEVSSANPELGEATDTVEAEYSGQPLTIAFNVRYLLEALETFPRQANATVGLKDDSAQAILRVDEDPDFLYVVMPMRST